VFPCKRQVCNCVVFFFDVLQRVCVFFFDRELATMRRDRGMTVACFNTFR